MIGVFGGGRSNDAVAGPSAAIRDSAVTLRVQFKDPDGVPTSVDDPTLLLTRDGISQTLDVIGSTGDTLLRYTLTADGATGLYKITFLTTGLKPGLYFASFAGAWVDGDAVTHTLLVEGTFELGTVSHLNDLIRRVSAALMDDLDPNLYRLDEPIAQWSADHIYSYIRDAVNQMNVFPPRLTNFEVDTLPNDYLVVLGATINALYARARFEKANELDYTDVHSLNIKRADFYKSLADTRYTQWKEMVIAYKQMTPPTPIGLRGVSLPYRISRVLGLLPNSQSLFSG